MSSDMTGTRKMITGAVLLASLHFVILLAGFVAPNDPATQNRELPFVPPSRLHFVDARGHVHLRPFIYRWAPHAGSFNEYDESRDREYPIHFLVAGTQYRIAGWVPARIHLFGVEEPARAFLLGTDNFGRDQFSRILFGGQISVAAGILATLISLGLGTLVGCISGLYGKWIDEVAMRFAELFLVLPWIYLLFAVRSFLPLHMSPTQTFFLLITVIGTIGWARPARLVRGIVLGARNQNYVKASRGFGASDLHLMRHHILPLSYGALLTQAALLVPQYILAEVTLSFFGLGVSEPNPSWGSLLAILQQYNVLVSYWWMFAPAVALVVVSFGYLSIANAFHERLQSVSI